MPNPSNAPRRDLKPCPHCGGPAALRSVYGKPFHSRVRCDNFNCGATTKEQPSEELAVAAWNRRGAR